MPREKSRTQRWKECADALQKALVQMQDAQQAFSDALSDLKDVQEEYAEWRNNLPENLEGSTLAEKLDAVVEIDLDVEPDLLDCENVMDEVESVDLPLGFGRD